jgi:hypothetical protein
MKHSIPTIVALAAVAIASPTSASTLLFADNFNDNPNNVAETFNNNLESTQSGSIGVKTYTVGSGSGNAVQHSNASEMLLASFGGTNFGRVSLDNDFAVQANALDQALVFSFELRNVSGFLDGGSWGGFTIGGTQNPFVNAGGGAAILFRQNGAIQAFNGGTDVVNTATGFWSPADIVTVTLSGAGGVGSAFNGNGSVVNYRVGGNDLGSFTLAQQTAGFMTFGIDAPSGAYTGIFKIDNLSVTAVPEPSAALLGGLSVLALLRRRRA